MREILFRGKLTNKKEWVEGALIAVPGFTAILEHEDTRIDYPYLDEVGGVIDGGVLVVILETVGAYTGRTDRNGVKIFEGDIVKTWIEGGAHSGFSWPLGVVEFRESAFGVAHGKYKFTPLSAYAPRVLMEVVGNIHDNPELLKEGE